MTGQPPPSRNRDLGFDELIAIFVAFTAIGTILWWGLTRRDTGFNLADSQLFSAPSASETEPNRLVVPSPSNPRITPRPTVPSAPASPGGLLVPETESDSAPTRTETVATPTPTPPAAAILPAPIVVAPPISEAAVEFPDVPADYWARPFIIDLSRRDIIAGFGDGTFNPDQPVTRAEYAAMLQKVLPPEERQQPIAFTDVTPDYWAQQAIDAAVVAGFLKGYPEGNFQPEQPISRAQVLASLVNGIQLTPASQPSEVVQLFQDNAQIPTWAVPSVATATQSGLVVNYPQKDLLNPNQPATRAEITAMIYQMLKATGQVEPIGSQYIVQP